MNSVFYLTYHLIILFQFCYTLSSIQYYLRNFKHNDIKPNNLLVKLIDDIDSKNYIKYEIFGKKFYIPQTKYIIKLHDFDYVYSNKFRNKKITHSVNLYKKGYNSETNCLYDLHSYINFTYHNLKTNAKNESFTRKLETLVFSPKVVNKHDTTIRKEKKLDPVKLGNGKSTNWKEQQERLEISKQYTIAPAYNKGPYMVVAKSDIKTAGRKV